MGRVRSRLEEAQGSPKALGRLLGQITVKGQKVDAIIARPPVKMVVKNGIGARTEALRKAQERANPRYPGLNWQRMFFNRKGQVKITPALYPADVPRILLLKRQSAEYQPIAQQA